jgi:hypothetical protein
VTAVRGAHSAVLVDSVRGNVAMLSNIAELRRRAHQTLDEGAVTSSCSADRDSVLRLLNAAMATEIVCIVHDDLAAGRVAIELHREMMGLLGSDDAAIRRLLEGSLALEVRHAEEIVALSAAAAHAGMTAA